MIEDYVLLFFANYAQIMRTITYVFIVCFEIFEFK